MPFKTEHAARIQTTSGVTNIRRVKGLDDGVSAIVGTKNGKGVEVSIRFDKTKFSETRAKKWLEDNNYKPIKFEPAISGQGDYKMPYHTDKKKKEKDMMEEEEKEMEIPNPNSPDKMQKEKYAMDDLYTNREEAEKAAPAMGLEGSHTHQHRIDGENVEFFMPGKNHEEYLKAKAEMEAKQNEDKEKDMMDKDREEKMEDEDKKMEDEDEKEKKMSKGEDCDCDNDIEVCDDSCEDDPKNYDYNQTFNIDGVEIFSTGVWNGDKYAKKDLEAMVTNFGKTGFEPPIKLGHNEDQPEMKDGEPALGYIDKIYTAGNKLLADFKEIPQVLYDAMKRGNYKRVSSEIYWNYTNNGSVLDRVLKAVAILGTEIPAVTNLEAIENLYAKSDESQGETKLYYSPKESELMEKDITKEYQALQDKIKSLEKANAVANEELEKSRTEKKEALISQFISEQKKEGKILPSFEKQLFALLSSTTDKKVYSYSKDDETIELSQRELLQEVVTKLPKLIEFAEISAEGEFIIDRQPYNRAGDEVDRRAQLYIKHGKVEKYEDAVRLVLKEDKDLHTEYANEQVQK
tara:strand:- start:186 stop:1904 length:1719 start_codon:yes stop_codon:yes gene_type:complete